MYFMKQIMTSVVVLSALIHQIAFAAEWVPLVTTTTFDGIRNDVLLAASGIVSIIVVLVGIGILWRNFGK